MALDLQEILNAGLNQTDIHVSFDSDPSNVASSVNVRQDLVVQLIVVTIIL